MGRPAADTPSNATKPADSVAQNTPATTAPSRSAPTGVLPVSNGTAVGDLLARADALEAQNKPLEARNILNRALFDRTTTQADRAALRDRLARLNETLVFSRTVVPGDPLAKNYSIAPGDSLAKIASSEKLDTDWRLIAQINGIKDPRRIRVGQSLKLVKGPYHAVVYKGEFRLDLFASATDSAGNRLYIRSFPVGLGEFGSTPVGSFIVRPSSKLINPVWTNPRTGEYFGADNPANPIGEHWIGLDPADDASSAYTQYGLHGTIEPQSIGTEKSMGCVRLAGPDIELLYGILVETKSTVEILP
jgi:LysM repeat protein